MKSMRVVPALLLLLPCVTGCWAKSRSSQQFNQSPLVGHVVVFWLKTPGDADARKCIVDASYEFMQIPGVTSVWAGEALASPRPNVDKTYDVAVVIGFKDRDALERYQVHPKHKAMLAEVGPLVDHTVAYDFTRAPRGAKGQGHPVKPNAPATSTP